MKITMKKYGILILSVVLFAFMAGPVLADSLETVRVIKFWTDTHDLIVQRDSGEELLIQHNHTCTSMSTEFPMQLVWKDGKVVQAKVASNEICAVYNYGPYTGDLKITKRVASPNILTPEHLAEVEWNGGRYQIDYKDGCKNIKDYVGNTAYVNAPKNVLDGATLYLPEARGQCQIASAQFLEKLVSTSSVTESPIKNLQYVAENNQVLFSWDAFTDKDAWLVLATYSKFKIDPSQFTLDQLPNLKRSNTSTIKFSQLVNDQIYYFYLTASNAKGELAPWTEMQITPKRTSVVLVNHPDPEPFEVTETKTATGYHLSWPDKSSDSREYIIMLYVNGKREMFKYVPGTQNSYDLENKPEWKGASFRFTVRSLPKKPTGLIYYDGIFWKAS